MYHPINYLTQRWALFQKISQKTSTVNSVNSLSLRDQGPWPKWNNPLMIVHLPREHNMQIQRFNAVENAHKIHALAKFKKERISCVWSLDELVQKRELDRCRLVSARVWEPLTHQFSIFSLNTSLFKMPRVSEIERGNAKSKIPAPPLLGPDHS